MKLIFLDIDGVMTSAESRLYVDYASGSATLLHRFDTRCVKVLNYVLKRSSTELVLTSSWRLAYPVEQQNHIFASNGVSVPPAGRTIDLGYENRADEIRQYLRRKPTEAFVILDDLPLDGFANHFVHVNPMTGLHKTYLPRIFAILNVPEPNQPPP